MKEKNSAAVKLGKQVKQVLRTNYSGWLFTLPLTIGILVFTIYPMIQSLYYSFFDFSGFNTFEFAGWGNYEKILKIDTEFYKVLSNTVLYAVISVPLMLVLSYFVALLVNMQVKGVTVFRVFYYLPCMIPGVVSSVIWKDIMSDTGALNTILSLFNIPPNPFFSAASTSMFAVIVMGLWGVGGGMVLWIAAFKNIPTALYEAAKIDGAGAMRRLVSITIPMSTSMIFYNLVTGIIGSLQINSTMIFAPQGGKGMEGSIYFYAVKIYKEAFEYYSLGYACALAWVLFIIIAALTAVVFKTSKWAYYGEDA